MICIYSTELRWLRAFYIWYSLPLLLSRWSHSYHIYQLAAMGLVGVIEAGFLNISQHSISYGSNWEWDRGENLIFHAWRGYSVVRGLSENTSFLNLTTSAFLPRAHVALIKLALYSSQLKIIVPFRSIFISAYHYVAFLQPLFISLTTISHVNWCAFWTANGLRIPFGRGKPIRWRLAALKVFHKQQHVHVLFQFGSDF